MPAGLLIHYGGHLIYHLGDTALFSDLQLIGRRGDKVDLALVPIGGHYTMDRYDAVTAVEFVNPSQVIPIHYDTFPLVETDAEAFKQDVENAGFSQVYVLNPGDTHKLDDPRRRPHQGRARRRCRRSAASSPTSKASPRPTRVTGEWDFVAILRVRNPEERRAVVTAPVRRARRHQGHPDDGGVRGLLAARPRGAVQHRQLIECRSSPPPHRPTLEEELAPLPHALRARRDRGAGAARRGGDRRCSRAGRRPRTGRAWSSRSRSRSTCATRTAMQRVEPATASCCTSQRDGQGRVHRRAARAAARTRATSAACCPSTPRASWSALKERFPDLELVEEGKVRINRAAGYSLVVPREPQPAAVRPARAAARARARRADGREAADAGHARGAAPARRATSAPPARSRPRTAASASAPRARERSTSTSSSPSTCASAGSSRSRTSRRRASPPGS